ncbi:hypothetical protein [Pedobacter frigoris]|uniref:hypothetical protein n=1 Tax=Pedobacter frigoris TaxID=2571272 RepID=UPI00293051A1|nr:hypothetical protein [Pedobacter frigoris]
MFSTEFYELRKQMAQWDRQNCFDFARGEGYELGQEMALATSLEEKKSAVVKCIKKKIELVTIAEITGFDFPEINDLLWSAQKKAKSRYWDYCLVLDFVKDEAFQEGAKDTIKEIETAQQASILKIALAMKKEKFTLLHIQKSLHLTETQIKWLRGASFLKQD